MRVDCIIIVWVVLFSLDQGRVSFLIYHILLFLLPFSKRLIDMAEILLTVLLKVSSNKLIVDNNIGLYQPLFFGNLTHVFAISALINGILLSNTYKMFSKFWR